MQAAFYQFNWLLLNRRSLRLMTFQLSTEGVEAEPCLKKLDVPGHEALFKKFVGTLVVANSHFSSKRIIATGTIQQNYFEGEIAVFEPAGCKLKNIYAFSRPSVVYQFFILIKTIVNIQIARNSA